jgi:single-strand DNA-binding protein
MNQLNIIGNLTADPQKYATQDGKTIASFTVAVNERRGGKDTATFFRCSAWEKRADPILRYLHKGDKVAVTGPVSLRTYTAKSGENRATLEVAVNDCEFLKTNKGEAYDDDLKHDKSGMTVVSDEDVPF